MLTLCFMALKNIKRYRIRSAVTISAIALSVAVSILVDALIAGISEQSTRNLLDFESGDLTIHAKGYSDKADELPTDLTIDRETKERISDALADEGIRHVPRYLTGAEFIHYDEESGLDVYTTAILVATDAEADGTTFRTASSVTDGSWLKENDDGIVVGSALADRLGLALGSIVTISCKSGHGFQETWDIVVKGIATTGNPTVNSKMAFISYDVLDPILVLDGAVTEIAIATGTNSGMDDGAKKGVGRLIGQDDEVEILSWQESNEDVVAIMNSKKGTSYIMLFFLFLIASAGITNTMLMAVMERGKENAMLRAMGFSRKAVCRLFVLEGTVSGVIGSAVGIAIAALVNYPISHYGIDLSSLIPEGVEIGYRISLAMYSAWNAGSFVGIPLIAILLSALFAYIPSRKAGKEEIAELLRRG